MEWGHYGQIIRDKNFQMYDYGDQNMHVYGQSTPPIYDLSVISKVPVAMFVGAEDDYADPRDTRWAASEIKSMVYYHEMPNMDHQSFIFGKNMTFL